MSLYDYSSSDYVYQYIYFFHLYQYNKVRFDFHKSSFKLEQRRTSTTFSYHLWKLKNKNNNFSIKWEVVKKVRPFAPGDRLCKLCLQEKLSILRSAPSLNFKKKNEIFGHCMHKKRFQLNHNNNSLSTD